MNILNGIAYCRLLTKNEPFNSFIAQDCLFCILINNKHNAENDSICTQTEKLRTEL